MVFRIGGLALCFLFPAACVRVSQAPAPASALAIESLGDNRDDYPDGLIPQYAKFEVSFHIANTVDQNRQFPYDPQPPNGIDPAHYPLHRGITVDGLFLPPGQTDWAQAWRQPAFYFHGYDAGGQRQSWADDGQNPLSFEWYYPNGQDSWKVRFAPDRPGTWQFRLAAVDAAGAGQTAPQSFTVTHSDSRGFIRVSPADPRYFEFSDGTPFLPYAIAHQLDLANPVSGNAGVLQTYSQNGVNLIRTWASGLYGAAWPEWSGGRGIYDGYLPRPGVEAFHDPAESNPLLGNQLTVALISTAAMDAGGWYDACRFNTALATEPVKPHTDYRLQIKYQAVNLVALDSTRPFGLVGKVASPANSWPAACDQYGVGQVITDYGHDASGWATISGTWNSGALNFLPRLAFGLENVADSPNGEAKAWVDSVSLREDLGGGRLGPELLQDPSMQYDTYYREYQAFRLDKAIEQAEAYGVYLKVVLQDKNDMIFYKINDDGTYVLSGSDNQAGFYGVGRALNKTRWLQQAYWRYLQARWGYSTAIHSWELTNEGDYANADARPQVDELGKTMHCRVFGVEPGLGDGQKCALEHPNAHLVTTSFDQYNLTPELWANPLYPNVDYGDVHAYISTGYLRDPIYERDSAAFHLDYSAEARASMDSTAAQNNLVPKPMLRGETAIDYLCCQQANADLSLDANGAWLHTFLWSTLDPGALGEVYWQLADEIASGAGPDGVAGSGLWEIYSYISGFTANIPLNNGYYQDAQAVASSGQVQVIGQKDVTHDRAHLWARNVNFTWGNVVAGAGNYAGLAGTITLSGFSADASLPVEWHQFTAQGVPTIATTFANTDAGGILVLDLPAQPALTDAGIKIGNYAAAHGGSQ